ncbi:MULTISPECIES: hypothetical protein [Micromonospora]|nr:MULTISPECIES: hypothetical protein [unclassified Micromonospora]MBQ0980276.1 hypothetical protein [Micromonospora sp. M61]MBQ1040738.1 hypothetical protein [Micromonospora sp. C81]WTI22265.1 hypothetical protein OG886_03935 [Micromonospora zamorensis]
MDVSGWSSGFGFRGDRYGHEHGVPTAGAADPTRRWAAACVVGAMARRSV